MRFQSPKSELEERSIVGYSEKKFSEGLDQLDAASGTAVLCFFSSCLARKPPAIKSAGNTTTAMPCSQLVIPARLMQLVTQIFCAV
jgi:hypothetical protein